MKVLILGGSGFIGSWILKELISRKLKVNILSRKNVDIPESHSCKVFYGDCGNKEDIENAIEGCDTIFHAASYYPVYSVKKYEQYNKAVQQLDTVIEASKKHGIKRFVFISTPTVLSPTKESLEASTYCFIKYHLHRRMEEEIDKGFPGIIIIPGGCFGPGDRKVITGRVILEIVSRRLRVMVNGIMNVVDVRDVARGTVDAALKAEAGSCYQLGNWNCTFYEFAKIVTEIADLPPIKYKLPYIMCKNISRLLELLQYYSFGGNPVFPEVGLDLIHFGSYIDPGKAIKELKFTTLPVEKTIYDSIEWYRVNNYLTLDGKINIKRLPAFR